MDIPYCIRKLSEHGMVARSIKWLKIQLKINMDMDQTVNHIKLTRIPQKKTTTKWWKVFFNGPKVKSSASHQLWLW